MKTNDTNNLDFPNEEPAIEEIEFPKELLISDDDKPDTAVADDKEVTTESSSAAEEESQEESGDNDGNEAPAKSEDNSEEQTSDKKAKKKKKKDKPAKKKKKFHIYVAILFVWLGLITFALTKVYEKFNDFMVYYEDSYQESRPNLVIDEIVTHFENYEIDYIWEHMDTHPEYSQFESEETIKALMLEMIDGKEITCLPSEKYSEATPAYVIEADGLVVADITLGKDLDATREFGFPTYVLKSMNFYTAALESVTVSAPVNYDIYINGVKLDYHYVSSGVTMPADANYVEPYGHMVGIHQFKVTDLYAEPEVVIKTPWGVDAPIEYDEARDIYSTGYATTLPDRDEIEQFSIDYTITFASVISRDEQLSSLYPYFPEGSATLDAISRNSALSYFTGHGAVTIENVEVRDFVAYSDRVVYIEVYIEQWMQMGWGGSEPEVVPTDARIYLVKMDGEWKIASMRF